MTPGVGRHVFRPYADYQQFYLGDSQFDADTASESFWTPQASARKLAIAPPGLIGVGTETYGDVDVVVEIRENEPPADFDDWDHVVAACLSIPSGQLVIDGCLAYRPESSPRISVSPGMHRVRVYYGGLDVVGGDHYSVVLWLAGGVGENYCEPEVLKQMRR